MQCYQIRLQMGNLQIQLHFLLKGPQVIKYEDFLILFTFICENSPLLEEYMKVKQSIGYFIEIFK